MIDYIALPDELAERVDEASKSNWRHLLRPCTLLYNAMWSLIGVGLVYALFIRSDIELTVSTVRNPVYVVQSIVKSTTSITFACATNPAMRGSFI